ncbi:hypothetical protein EUTSA_v10027927mg [Eutrema salsugineum]|uniref:DSBA-like thioredoxin domain-containing protein n=1 Tax=Eutrema salsugineum TaxID=72664 RepID=V4NL59_EUTSA|nr:uncharacterized protein LOC18022637 [Eutrema salsugineum]XP_006405683.1 uncharacterized protein LOC18022637 [Eutrema salsugineum]ESQ47135.1 hypothetical protein EUTSA_v10027927mg [Eutrema salsugineum]ESQ47136.1 hypothetical protein EUTSA_v10027927mg [Eutrema salsugineum]
MAESASNIPSKKLIQIDVSSDTVCPWCFVGKKNLDKAIDASKDQYNFEIRWHPFFLDASAPKEGVNKKEFYQLKFGSRVEGMFTRMSEIFGSIGLDYDTSGLTGNTLDSHRLIHYAGKHAPDKQHSLVEELCLGYFTQGKYIGDREFLVETARNLGIEGAEEFISEPNNGVTEVEEEMKKYSRNITGVPHYIINGKVKLSGAQPPETFQSAFETASA